MLLPNILLTYFNYRKRGEINCKKSFTLSLQQFRIFLKFVSKKPCPGSQITGCWDNRVYKEMNLASCQWPENCSKRSIRYHKYIERLKTIYQIFDRLLKTSQKGSVQLEKVENCATLACRELIEAGKKRKALRREDNYHYFWYTDKT